MIEMLGFLLHKGPYITMGVWALPCIFPRLYNHRCKVAPCIIQLGRHFCFQITPFISMYGKSIDDFTHHLLTHPPPPKKECTIVDDILLPQ